MIEEKKTQQKVPHTGIKAAGSSPPKEKQVQKERELLCANADGAAWIFFHMHTSSPLRSRQVQQTNQDTILQTEIENK